MARGIKRPDGALDTVLNALKRSYGETFGFAKSGDNPRNSAFDITPAKTQILQEQIQLTSDFMQQAVDFEVVDALAGEYDRLGTTGQILSTVTTDRYGYDPTSGGTQVYQLDEVTSDSAITYTQMAKWHHRPEFLMIVQAVINKLRAISYEKVGWWGQHRVAGKTATDEPLGKQIAVGWLQWLINNLPYQVVGVNLATGDTNTLSADRRDYTVGNIKLGPGTVADGTASGYTTTNAGFAIGVTQLPLITGTGTLLPGEVFTIAGDATATKYTVTTGITAPGTITFFPSLRGTLSAAVHAITVVPIASPSTVSVANSSYTGPAVVSNKQYLTLDKLVLEKVQELIPIEFQDNLTVILGRGMYNYLTMGLLDVVAGGMERLPSERIQVQNLRQNLNIAGYPVIVSDVAPAFMVAVTRLKGGAVNNQLLGNSNLVKLTHAMIQKSVMDFPIKSAMIDFMYENLFYGLRNPEAMFFIHPDSFMMWDGAKWVYASATAWKL